MNFRQVISNIKEGQEFKCDDGLFTIRCLNNGAIEIHNKDGRAFGFEKEDTFSKIEKPVSFMEAIKASQEGKVIKVNVEDRVYTYYPKESKWCELSAKEGRGGLSTYEILEGKWYLEE